MLLSIQIRNNFNAFFKSQNTAVQSDMVVFSQTPLCVGVELIIGLSSLILKNVTCASAYNYAGLVVP